VRLLLDTATFLFAALGDPRISGTATALIQDPGNDVLLSVVSGWEIAIKHALGRLDLPAPPDRFVPEVCDRMGVEVLPIGMGPALRIGRLPRLHDDPFDRMLVSQAIEHGLTILTPDEAIRQYPIPTAW
jgi:PIN domain nuclease of toxin-antitoxin system